MLLCSMRKSSLTTKGTKDTKFEKKFSPSFVLFASFVVKVYLFPPVPVKKYSAGCSVYYLYSSLMKPDFSSSATNELSMNCSGLAVLPAGFTEKLSKVCMPAEET